jgi:hypothetical protein
MRKLLRRLTQIEKSEQVGRSDPQQLPSAQAPHGIELRRGAGKWRAGLVQIVFQLA